MADCGTGTRDARVPDQCTTRRPTSSALTGETAGRKPGFAPAGVDPKPKAPSSSQAPKPRPVDLGLDVPIFPFDSECDQCGQAGDRNPLAPSRLPRLLALEVWAAGWATKDQSRNPGLDPAHEP